MSNQGLRRPARLPVPSGEPAHMASSPARPPTDDVSREMPDAPPAPRRRGRQKSEPVGFGSLPPLGLLLARPLLLLVCAIVGAVVGLVSTGGGGYQATAGIEFSATGYDSLLVKQTGQTLARTAVSAPVTDAAAGVPDSDLADRVSAEWETDTRVVNVTVTASTPEAAVAEANAVAQAVVATTEASIRERLTAAREGSNQLLNTETLDSPDAEEARRAQLGNSLGARQDAVSSESSALVVADPATEAAVSGLTRPMGAAIGLVAGLLLGGLLCMVLSVRGLRVNSVRTLRYLVPETRLSSPAEAAQLSGQIIESGLNCVAIVAMDGTEKQGVGLAADITQFVRANGRTVKQLGPITKSDRAAALDLLRRDVRDDFRGRTGDDLLVVVVSSDSEAAALLQGQSNLQVLVVVRRRRTMMTSMLEVMKAFGRAQPVLVLTT